MQEPSGLDAALSRPWISLHLAPELRAGFEAWAFLTRRRENRIFLSFTLAVSLLFVVLDTLAGIRDLGLAVKLGLEGPMLLSGCYLLHRNLTSTGLALVAAGPFVVTIGATIALGLAAPPAFRGVYIVVTAASALAGNQILRLRFRHAVIMGLCNMLLYAGVPSSGLVPMPSGEIIAIVGSIALLNCAVLIAVALRERSEQDLYLLGLRSESQSRELQRLVAELSSLSNLDALTGTGNRRSFHRTYAAAWRAATAAGERLAVVLFDVDHFKLFNDAAGHTAGDDCLRAVAGAIAAGAGCDRTDVSRYGGEEFALIVSSLPGLIDGDPIAVAENVRRSVEMLALPHPGLPSNRCVTISAGVATAHPGAENIDPETLVEAADAALYRAKRAGRNRVGTPDYRSAAA